MPRKRIINGAAAIREAIDQSMKKDSSVFIVGEGVPDPKGVFGTTLGLRKKYTKNRVWDMPLSENAMTGTVIGAAISGMKPILVHQRLDFALLSLDQIINNAAKWFYMFGGQQSVPLVIRMIIGHGWGQGAQHSQNLQALFAHIPGLKVVMPSQPSDAKGLLIASIQDPNPVIFLEHRWIHNATGDVPKKLYATPLGKANITKKGSDITIISSSYMALEALRAAQLLESLNISAEVVDLRTISPLDEATIIRSIKKTGRLLVVDSAWTNGGIAGEIITRVVTKHMSLLKTMPARIGLPNLPTPSSPGLTKYYYPNIETIMRSVCDVLKKDSSPIKKILAEDPSLAAVSHDVPNASYMGPF
ncbi:MAG TPA: transketolase C-terminal domain-containing protein [Candidatus Andersenbacteria bacterium]|nr:transketolase C-terminal domain-containing protein [Candidatus Andersenbacteria bacterium]